MLPQLLGALCIQCLPYTVYVLLSRGRGWRARVLVGLGYAALLQIALASDVDPLSAFVVPAFGLAYFALAAVPVYAAARAFGDAGRVFESHEALAGVLGEELAAMAAPTGLRVLVKGSRGSAMDRIVAALLASHGKGEVDAA